MSSLTVTEWERIPLCSYSIFPQNWNGLFEFDTYNSIRNVTEGKNVGVSDTEEGGTGLSECQITEGCFRNQ